MNAVPSTKRKRARAEPSVRDSGFSTPSLDRALGVLECLGRHPRGLGLTELAAEMGLSLNFVYRVTQSLTAHGYVSRDPDKTFRLGAKLLTLCQPVSDDIPLTEAVMPALRWLSDQTGEAAHVGIIAGYEGLVLERVVGHAQIKFYVERGTRFPLHTSAPGKVMLAFMPEPEREAVIHGMTFERYQPWTISNRKEFVKCLNTARVDGYAVDVSEHLDGHHCIGAPILNAQGEAVASLWITGLSTRLSESRMLDLAPIVKQAGLLASAAMKGGGLAGR